MGNDIMSDGTIKILAVAPYERMARVMEEAAREFDDVTIDVRIGDLEKGLSEVTGLFSENYKAIVSRGGTAKMIQRAVGIPVIEVELGTADLLRALSEAHARPTRLGVVGFGNVVRKLEETSDVLPFDVDVYAVEERDELEDTLLMARGLGYESIACDTAAHKVAQGIGMATILMESGHGAVREALGRAVGLCRAGRVTMAHNDLLWKILRNQPGNLVIYSRGYGLVFSDLDDSATPVLEFLSAHVDDRSSDTLTFQRSGIVWRAKAVRVRSGEQDVVAFSLRSYRPPIPGTHTGIERANRDEVEAAVASSTFGICGGETDVHDLLEKAVASGRPIMMRGPMGSGKDQIAKLIYLASPETARPFVQVDCSLLTQRAFEFLTQSHHSPLFEGRQAIYLKSVHALTDTQWKELLAIAQITALPTRTFLIVSGNETADGLVPTSLTTIADQLHCLVLDIPPIAQVPGAVRRSTLNLVSHLADRDGITRARITPEALDLVAESSFPRNYIQLRQTINRAWALREGTDITASDMREALDREGATRFASEETPSEETGIDLMRPLADIERDVARLVLASCHGNKTECARVLGISRTTLWRLLK